MITKDGETIYEVKFQIKTSTQLGKVDGFMAKKSHIDQFNPTHVHRKKNDAINAAIKHLEGLKD